MFHYSSSRYYQGMSVSLFVAQSICGDGKLEIVIVKTNKQTNKKITMSAASYLFLVYRAVVWKEYHTRNHTFILNISTAVTTWSQSTAVLIFSTTAHVMLLINSWFSSFWQREHAKLHTGFNPKSGSYGGSWSCEAATPTASSLFWSIISMFITSN